MQTEDRQVREFLAKFTLLPLDRIDDLVTAHDKAPEQRQAQRVLAQETTTLVHGAAAAEAAEQASWVLSGGDPADLGPAGYELLAGEVPTTPLPDLTGEAGGDIVGALVGSGLALSRSDARRSLEAGAVYVNGERVGPDRALGEWDVRHGRYVLVRKGKRSYALLTARPA